MKTLKTINDLFIKISEYIACILSGIVCAMIVWWAAKRYLLHGEFYGAEELILAIAFWMYFIGAYVATHEDSHISADLFTGMLKTEKAKQYAKLVRLAISLIAFVLLTWLACDFVAFDIVHNKITVMYRFPQAYIHIILPVSFGLSCLYTMAHMINTVISIYTGCGDETAGPGSETQETE
jgi:TRAP-type C4-dicarboxylate transport system permease small subunit